MTELKIYGSEYIIKHDLGDEFNEEVESLIVSIVITDYHISSWCSNKIEMGGHHVLSINNKNQSKFNMIFSVDDQGILTKFLIYDHMSRVYVDKDIFKYCYKLLMKG